MVEFLVLVCAFIAGALLYFALRKDIEAALFIRVEKNLWFPLLIIILLISGVYVTETIHLSESAARASNAQQSVHVMGCIIENAADCTAKANAANNDASIKLQNGTIQTGDFFIPFSLTDVLSRNAFSYFIAGILVVWLAIFGGSLRVKE